MALTSFSCAHARVIGCRCSLLASAMYIPYSSACVCACVCMGNGKQGMARESRFTSVVNTVEIAALSMHCVYSRHVFTECVSKGLYSNEYTRGAI